jgi:hypothetical protein
MERSLLFVVTGTVLLCAPIACSGADDSTGDGLGTEPGTNPSDETSSRSEGLRFGIPHFFRFRHPFRIPGSGGGGGAPGAGGASTQPPGAGGASTQPPPGAGGASTQPPPGAGGASTQPPITGDPIGAARTPDGRAIPQSSLPGGGCPQVVVLLGFWSCVTIGDQCSFAANGVTHHCGCEGGTGEGQAPVWSCK